MVIRAMGSRKTASNDGTHPGIETASPRASARVNVSLIQFNKVEPVRLAEWDGWRWNSRLT